MEIYQPYVLQPKLDSHCVLLGVPITWLLEIDKIEPGSRSCAIEPGSRIVQVAIWVSQLSFPLQISQVLQVVS